MQREGQADAVLHADWTDGEGAAVRAADGGEAGLRADPEGHDPVGPAVGDADGHLGVSEGPERERARAGGAVSAEQPAGGADSVPAGVHEGQQAGGRGLADAGAGAEPDGRALGGRRHPQHGDVEPVQQAEDRHAVRAEGAAAEGPAELRRAQGHQAHLPQRAHAQPRVGGGLHRQAARRPGLIGHPGDDAPQPPEHAGRRPGLQPELQQARR